MKQHTDPIVYNEVSEEEPVTGSELDDESELVEVLSGELLLGALPGDDIPVDIEIVDDVAAGVVRHGSDISSDGLLLSTLLGEVDSDM